MLAVSSVQDEGFDGRSSGQPMPGADAMVMEPVVEQAQHTLHRGAHLSAWREPPAVSLQFDNACVLDELCFQLHRSDLIRCIPDGGCTFQPQVDAEMHYV